MTDFGFELEIRSGAWRVLSELRNMGLTDTDEFHNYHCRCDTCDYTRSDVSFFAQEDCTVDGEIISTIHEYGSARHLAAVRGISRAMIRGEGAVTGDTGCHVHVSNDGMGHDAMVRLSRLFVRYAEELRDIAQGGQSRVRGYNGNAPVWRGGAPVVISDPERRFNTALASFRRYGEWYDRDVCSRYMVRTPTLAEFQNPPARQMETGSWLAWKSHTNEFRLWNATRAAWRINTYIGLSVAMTEAAKAGEDTIGPDDHRPVEAVLSPWLDDRTWAGILRQRFETGGLAA